MPEENALVFTTGTDTRHGREMLANPHVSGGIVLETKVVGRIRGVQVSGMAYSVGDYETVGEKDYETVGLKDYETVGLKDYETVSKSKSLKVSKSSAKTAYLKKFPFAIAAKLDLWVLHLEYVKMTDNRLGFGRKIEWRRGAESE
jgi:uncharacterized protein YhbP (UPF0306 family)